MGGLEEPRLWAEGVGKLIVGLEMMNGEGGGAVRVARYLPIDFGSDQAERGRRTAGLNIPKATAEPQEVSGPSKRFCFRLSILPVPGGEFRVNSVQVQEDAAWFRTENGVNPLDGVADVVE